MAMLTARNAARIRKLGETRFGWISQLRWSPRGDMLAVAGGDGVAIYAGGFGGAPDMRLRGHTAPVKDIAFHPDSAFIASCGADMTVRLWRLEGGNAQEMAALSGHNDSVEAVAWLGGGKSLATGGADGAIRVWDSVTGELRSETLAHSDEITALATVADGRWLYSTSRDGTVSRWDTQGDMAGAVMDGRDDWARDIAAHGELVASAGRDGAIRLWQFRPHPLPHPKASEGSVDHPPCCDGGDRRGRTQAASTPWHLALTARCSSAAGATTLYGYVTSRPGVNWPRCANIASPSWRWPCTRMARCWPPAAATTASCFGRSMAERLW